MHESWYRDSEFDDKVGYYRGYFEEDDMPITDQDAERIASAVWNRENPALDIA